MSGLSTLSTVWTQAQQIVDFGVKQDTAYLVAYQNSSVIGRGFLGRNSIYCPVSDDPYIDNVVLLMHMNGVNGSTSFIDVKGKTPTLNGSPVISTTQYKFGGASGYLATGNTLSFATDSKFNFGTGDFTVELFVYLTTVANWGTLIQIGNWGVAGGFTLVSGATCVKACLNNSDTGNSGSPITVNTWTHVAATRVSGVFRIFVSGTKIREEPGMNQNLGGSYPLNIFLGGGIINNCVGYADEIRVTRGIGRYTASFTPPTIEYPDT